MERLVQYWTLALFLQHIAMFFGRLRAVPLVRACWSHGRSPAGSRRVLPVSRLSLAHSSTEAVRMNCPLQHTGFCGLRFADPLGTRRFACGESQLLPSVARKEALEKRNGSPAHNCQNPTSYTTWQPARTYDPYTFTAIVPDWIPRIPYLNLAFGSTARNCRNQGSGL